MIALEVLGTPAPKGSGRAILIGGRARHVASGSDVNQRALKAWDVAVREAARDAVGAIAAPPYVAQPLVLAIEFRMTRPSSHWGNSSKLLRATEDSLTGIVWDDDSRVGLHLIDRVFARPGREGATILVLSRAELVGRMLEALLSQAVSAGSRSGAA